MSALTIEELRAQFPPELLEYNVNNIACDEKTSNHKSIMGPVTSWMQDKEEYIQEMKANRVYVYHFDVHTFKDEPWMMIHYFQAAEGEVNLEQLAAEVDCQSSS